MTAIELELTDESLINPNRIQRIILEDNIIIVVEAGPGEGKILVFNTDGKFLRSIGSRGQGPGEYTGIKNVALDGKNKRIYIISYPKIICYDLDGKFIKESTQPIQSNIYQDINYINDALLLLVDYVPPQNDTQLKKTHSLYRLNDDLQVLDSCIIRENYTDFASVISVYFYNDFILKGNTSVYLYYSEIYPKLRAPNEIVLRDTLYRLEDNLLVPELKLKFRNDGIDGFGAKFIDLLNIFRSSRYVFSIYIDNQTKNKYHFCYDTITGEGNNMQDGYTDDINGIEKRISIRPLITDSEICYFWHTNMKPEDKEEPNPTLYIIKLKK